MLRSNVLDTQLHYLTSRWQHCAIFVLIFTGCTFWHPTLFTFLLNLQTCLSEVRGPLVDLGVSEYGILSAITTLSETQNDLGLNQQQQTSGSTHLTYSVDDITLFRQIALDLRKFSPSLASDLRLTLRHYCLIELPTVVVLLLYRHSRNSRVDLCCSISNYFPVSQSAPSQRTAL